MSDSGILTSVLTAQPLHERNPSLVKLLKILEQEDRLFHYNVPPNIRQTYTDDDLTKHLEQVYSQSSFVIEDQEEIKRHLRVGDFVINKKEYSYQEIKLKRNAEGMVTGTSAERKVWVHFKDYGSLELPTDALVVKGKKATTFRGVKTYSQLVRASEFSGGLSVGHLVEYAKDDILGYKEHLPAEALGLVVQIWSAGNREWLHIIWANQKTLQQESVQKEEYASKPHAYWGFKEIKLVVRNEVDYAQLYQESRKEKSTEITPLEPQ